MDLAGVMGAITTMALLVIVQYTVLYFHPQHSLSTIALQLSAMALMFGAICGFLKWRDLI